jgi:thioredoxin reductase (NADPH)
MTPVPETPDLYGAFPRLSEAQLAELSPHGERRAVSPGDVLFGEGEPTTEFIVVLSGKVAMVEGHGRGPDEQTIAVHGPGRFLGELSLLTGQAAFLTAVVQEPGEVLAVPADEVRALVARDQALGDLILRAYLARRSLLIGLGTGFRIIGSAIRRTASDCASSPPATGCRTGGSTWRKTRRRTRCCASYASHPRTPRW